MTDEEKLKRLINWESYYHRRYSETKKEIYAEKIEEFAVRILQLESKLNLKKNTGWKEVKETLQSRIDPEKFADEIGKSYKRREEKARVHIETRKNYDRRS